MGPDFVHTMWSATYSLFFSRSDIFLLEGKKEEQEKGVGWPEILYTRDCSVLQLDFFSVNINFSFEGTSTHIYNIYI